MTDQEFQREIEDMYKEPDQDTIPVSGIPELTHENGLPEGMEVVKYDYYVPDAGDMIYGVDDTWHEAQGIFLMRFPIAILRKIEPEVFYGKLNSDHFTPHYYLSKINGESSSQHYSKLTGWAITNGWDFNGFCDEEGGTTYIYPFIRKDDNDPVRVLKLAKFTKRKE